MTPQTYQAPGGTLNYIGNQDYRGYLNYLGSTGNQLAKQLITGGNNNMGYVSNQGQLQNSSLLNPNLVSANTNFYKQYNQILNPSYLAGANIMGSLGGNYTAPPPNWDLTSIYNSAGKTAAGQVNPYYSLQLKQFQTNQAQAKALQEQQRQLSLQNLQNNLDTQLQTNDLGRTRTAQDVLTQEQQIGQQAQNRQEDQGQQFDQARIAQAKQLASSGLTTSGAGAQQVYQSQVARNTQESRQNAQDMQQIAAQELQKARTFEDLARSDVLAKQSKTQGEKQQQIDWDKFVQGQAQDLQSTKNTLEQQRLSRLSEVQKQLANQRINDMISKLSNPQQRLAAASAYGRAF